MRNMHTSSYSCNYDCDMKSNNKYVYFTNITGSKKSWISKVKKSSCDANIIDNSKIECSNHLFYFAPTKGESSSYRNKYKKFDSITNG